MMFTSLLDSTLNDSQWTSKTWGFKMLCGEFCCELLWERNDTSQVERNCISRGGSKDALNFSKRQEFSPTTLEMINKNVLNGIFKRRLGDVIWSAWRWFCRFTGSCNQRSLQVNWLWLKLWDGSLLFLTISPTLARAWLFKNGFNFNKDLLWVKNLLLSLIILYGQQRLFQRKNC